MEKLDSDVSRPSGENDGHFRLLIGSWAQAVWETDATGVVVIDSPSWRAYTGQTVEEWLGYGWLNAIHPDDRAGAEHQWREAVAAGRLVDAELRLRAPGGGWRWTNVRAAPVIEAGGATQKWVGMNIDIDARRRAETALLERERDLARVQRIGQVGGLDIDVANGLTSRRSPEFLRLHGLGLNGLHETHADWRARVHPDDVDATERHLFATLASLETSYDSEYRIVRPSDGAVRWIHARADIERDADGKAMRLVGAHLDVTDQKRMQDERRENEARQKFLLALSDALRATPSDAITDRAIGMLVDELRLDLCYVVTVYPDQNRADVIHQVRRSDIPLLPNVIRLSDFPLAFLEWRDRTLVSEDMSRDPALTESDRRNVAAMRFGALIAAPVRRGPGNPVWSIVGVMAQARTWTAHEISLIEEVAERTWTAVERARAEAALRTSEERYRALFESMDQAYAVVEVLKDESRGWYDFRFFDANPAFTRHTGIPYPVGKTATELLGSPNPNWTRLYGRVLDTGKPVRIEESESSLGRTFDLNIFGLEQGNNRVAVLFSDITERKRSERALNESERRLRTLVQGVPQLVWQAVDRGQWTWASPQWTEFTGQAEEDSHGYGWLTPVHPDDRERVREIWDGAVERGDFHADYRLCHAGEARYRWFQTRATPVRDDAGEIVEWLGTSTDVDDLRRLQDRQQILLAELQHRVRNILAVTRSIISRSDDGERSTEEYVAHLQGRISALARTQVLLTRTADTRVDLELLIRDEIVAQAASADQVDLSGETVLVSPKSAEVLTLAIHELATNATKYGALTRSSGRLDVRWHVEARDDQKWLAIVWRERGVPIIDAAPRRQGFGLELITRRIPYELKGYGSLELKPGGVESRIEFPLIEGESILQTDAGGR